jgi:hypothetical protein
MKFTGGFFTEESVTVLDQSDIPGSHPISVVFDGMAGLYVHITEDIARTLRRELGNVLDGIDHDRMVS